jgi:hypothetical protein
MEVDDDYGWMGQLCDGTDDGCELKEARWACQAKTALYRIELACTTHMQRLMMCSCVVRWVTYLQSFEAR